MGQHIKLTEARIREILSDVEKELRSSKMFDGTISMDYTLPPIKESEHSIRAYGLCEDDVACHALRRRGCLAWSR